MDVGCDCEVGVL